MAGNGDGGKQASAWADLPLPVMADIAARISGTDADLVCKGWSAALRGLMRPDLRSRDSLAALAGRMRVSVPSATRTALLRLRVASRSPDAQALADQLRRTLRGWYAAGDGADWVSALRVVAGLDVDAGTLAFLDFYYAVDPHRANPEARRVVKFAMAASAKHGALPLDEVLHGYEPLPRLPGRERVRLSLTDETALVVFCLDPQAFMATDAGRAPHEGSLRMAARALNAPLAIHIAGSLPDADVGPGLGESVMFEIEQALDGIRDCRASGRAIPTARCPVEPGGPRGYCFCSSAPAIDARSLLEPLMESLRFTRVLPSGLQTPDIRLAIAEIAGTGVELARREDAAGARAELLARGLVDRIDGVRPAGGIGGDEARMFAWNLEMYAFGSTVRVSDRYVPAEAVAYMRGRGLSLDVPALCRSGVGVQVARALCREGLIDPAVMVAYSRTVLGFCEDAQGVDLHRAAGYVVGIAAAMDGAALAPAGVQLLFEYGVSNRQRSGRATPPVDRPPREFDLGFADGYDVDWLSVGRAIAACVDTPIARNRNFQIDTVPAMYAWVGLVCARLRSDSESANSMLLTLREAVATTFPRQRAKRASRLLGLSAPATASTTLLYRIGAQQKWAALASPAPDPELV